jgi:pyruvate dehydrogenase E2 component (dihydrolipoamide acetyltransferase)
MQKVVLPRLFENMEEGTIGRWLVSPGSEVSVGTPLCELITEKTTLELPSEVAGTVRQLVAPEKAVVPPGFILALVGEAAEPLIDVSGENAALSEAGAGAGLTPSSNLSPTRLEEGVSPAPAPTSSSSGRLRATPAARRAAKDAGVELEAVAANFPGKVLSEDDVKQFAGGAG